MSPQKLNDAGNSTVTMPASPHNQYVIGVDIGGTNLRIALADTTGAILRTHSVSTVGIHDANLVVSLICKGVDELFRQTQLPRNQLCAIAAGAPGVTNVDDGIVIATSYLMGWRDVPLRAMLESSLGVPVAIDNDVNMAAFAESRVGAASTTRDFVFLAIGTGVGAGIILDGRLFRGMNWTAGEVGYMLVPGIPVAAVPSGEPGGLEHLVGGEGIKSQWQRRWAVAATSLPKELNATQIFEHALAGDSLAQSVLDQAAETLSYAIYNIYLILNCPLFVLGGGVGTHIALYDAVVRKIQDRDPRTGLKLIKSSLGTDAQLIGAVRVAIALAETIEIAAAATQRVFTVSE
jgi:glucokinase